MAKAQNRLSIPVMPAWLRIVGGSALLTSVVLFSNDTIAGRIFYGSVAAVFIFSGTHSILKARNAPLLVQNISSIIGWVILLVLIGSFGVDWWLRNQ